MNAIDLFLVLIILLCIYSGWLKGFINGALQLLLFVAGLVAGFSLYPYVSVFLEKHAPSLGIWNVPLSFILALVVVRIILSLIANQLLYTIPERAHTNIVNRIAGIIPGAINGIIWSTITAALLLSVPVSDYISDKARNSQLANKMGDQVEWLDEKFSPVFDEAVNKTMNKLTVEPESDKFVKLPFKDNHPEVREDLEAKMLVLVNEERNKAGLPSLKFDPEILKVARAHSRDMFARGYFSHVNPEGLSPFDRMKKAHIRFLSAGENLALGQTLSICHRGLMNSPGHRANILNQAFGRVGIAILDGGIYGLMITQNFRN